MTTWDTDLMYEAEFEAALLSRDETALTRVVLGRLDGCIYGTNIRFRLDRGQPTVWQGTTMGHGAGAHPAMARQAARALLQQAGTTTSTTARPGRSRKRRGPS